MTWLRNWQLRRAAIFAAGRLPFEAALERILPVVMAERSPLTIDGNAGFLCHAIMSSVLESGTQGMAPIFARGRAGFVDFFAEIFELSWKDSMSPQGLPSGGEAAGWLFDRLVHHGWPAKREARSAKRTRCHILIGSNGMTAGSSSPSSLPAASRSSRCGCSPASSRFCAAWCGARLDSL